MTITPSTMYWITRLDGITTTLTICTIIAIGTFVMCLWALLNVYGDAYVPSEKDKKEVKKATKISGIVLVLVTLVNIFTPTVKDMALIYVVPNIAESQVIKQDIPELYDLGINALKDWLKGDKDEKSKDNNARTVHGSDGLV